jgi:hypothetical protein
MEKKNLIKKTVIAKELTTKAGKKFTVNKIVGVNGRLIDCHFCAGVDKDLFKNMKKFIIKSYKIDYNDYSFEYPRFYVNDVQEVIPFSSKSKNTDGDQFPASIGD